MKISCTHLKLKNCLAYVTLTGFWKLNSTCNISPETAESRIWMSLKEMSQKRICGEKGIHVNVKEKWMNIRYIMNNCLVHVFERRESKCCAVLMKYHRKVKGKQMITLQMAQQLKTKNINVVRGKLFCLHLMPSTKEKAPINWHLTCQLTLSNI